MTKKEKRRIARLENLKRVREIKNVTVEEKKRKVKTPKEFKELTIEERLRRINKSIQDYNRVNVRRREVLGTNIGIMRMYVLELLEYRLTLLEKEDADDEIKCIEYVLEETRDLLSIEELDKKRIVRTFKKIVDDVEIYECDRIRKFQVGNKYRGEIISQIRYKQTSDKSGTYSEHLLLFESEAYYLMRNDVFRTSHLVLSNIQLLDDCVANL